MGMSRLFMLVAIAATAMMSMSVAVVDDRPGVKIIKGPSPCNVVWRFNANLWGSTLYWCNVDWQQRTAHVIVWKDANFWTGLGMPCIYCIWDIMPNGFYRTTLEKPNSRTFVQGWVYPPALGGSDGLKESRTAPPVEGGDE